MGTGHPLVLFSQERTVLRSGWLRPRWSKFVYLEGGDVPGSVPSDWSPTRRTTATSSPAWLRRKGVIPCIPPRKNRTGRRKTWDEEYKERWHIERTFAWVGNFRRLLVRYERLISMYTAFFSVACILICLRMVVK